jgi:hypothetical protein
VLSKVEGRLTRTHFFQVFSKSCASTFPLPGVADSYAVYLAIFALLVVPLSCMELTEQVAIQCVLAGCRVLLVVLMVGTVGAAYGSKGDAFPGQSGRWGSWLMYQSINQSINQ